MLSTNIVRGAAYAARGAYANAFDFATAVMGQPREADIPAITRMLREKGEQLRAEAARRPIDQDTARAWALERDVTRLELILERLDAAEGSEERNRADFDVLLGRLSELGLALREPELRIVDDFPEPYDGSNGWAMNLDVSDQRAYGVKAGVYVRRELLMPLYTPFLIAHELVHAICGQRDSEFLARGLEDGLGDIFGSLYLGRSVVEGELCEQMLFNSRTIYPQSQFWAIYGDGLHQALLLHDLIGVDGLIELLRAASKDGRQVIKTAERELLGGEFRGSEGAIVGDSQLHTFSSRYRAAARHLVVSPLAFYLAHELRIGEKVASLLAHLEVDSAAGERALAELQDRVFLAFFDKGEIWADETALNIQTGNLRYELTDAQNSNE